jgi:hypothetical protein
MKKNTTSSSKQRKSREKNNVNDPLDNRFYSFLGNAAFSSAGVKLNAESPSSSSSSSKSRNNVNQSATADQTQTTKSCGSTGFASHWKITPAASSTTVPSPTTLAIPTTTTFNTRKRPLSPQLRFDSENTKKRKMDEPAAVVYNQQLLPPPSSNTTVAIGKQPVANYQPQQILLPGPLISGPPPSYQQQIPSPIHHILPPNTSRLPMNDARRSEDTNYQKPLDVSNGTLPEQQLSQGVVKVARAVSDTKPLTAGNSYMIYDFEMGGDMFTCGGFTNTMLATRHELPTVPLNSVSNSSGSNSISGFMPASLLDKVMTNLDLPKSSPIIQPPQSISKLEQPVVTKQQQLGILPATTKATVPTTVSTTTPIIIEQQETTTSKNDIGNTTSNEELYSLMYKELRDGFDARTQPPTTIKENKEKTTRSQPNLQDLLN